MTIIRSLAGPLIGAVIGFVTNYIAIRMVFRPLEAKYLFGYRIPFTPGIVPRRKDMLADQLAQTVVARFFNWNDVEDVFLSPAFAQKVVNQICVTLRSDTPLSQIQEKVPLETVQVLEEALGDVINRQILSHRVIKKAVNKSCEELNGTEGVPGRGPLIGGILKEYSTTIIEMAESYLKEDGGGLIRFILAEERQESGNETIGDITRAICPEDEELKKGIRMVYENFMAQNVGSIASSIDIVSQIREKVRMMSAAEIEDIVEEVISKELTLVVLFGGLLGMIIGTVNIFI